MKQKLDIAQKIRLHNRFDIDVIDKTTGEIKNKAQAENIILDNIFSQILHSNNTIFSRYISFGSGTGTLDPTRTTLFTHRGYKEAGGTTIDNRLATENWYSCRKQITLLDTEFNGITISEVGLGTSTVYTHALLKDMNGNATTIDKTDTDIITIYATVYAVFDEVAWDNGNIRLIYPMVQNGSFASFASWLTGQKGPEWNLSQAARICWGGGKSPVSEGYGLSDRPLDTSGSPVYLSGAAAKSVSAKTATWQCRIPIGSGNSRYGLSSVTIMPYTHYSGRAYYTPWLFCSFPNTQFPGSYIDGEQVGIGDGETTDFTTYFPLIKSDAVVYVDGVEQTSGVTVMNGRPHTNDINFIMKLLRVAGTSPGDTYASHIPSIGKDDNAAFPDGETVFENTHYDTTPMKSARFFSGGRLFSSDDMITWTLAVTSTSSSVNTDIPVAHQSKRYWKLLGNESTGILTGGIWNILNDDYTDYKNIIFDTPPTQDAVITVDYTTEVIAKDENHVFDFSLTVEIGEYVEVT